MAAPRKQASTPPTFTYALGAKVRLRLMDPDMPLQVIHQEMDSTTEQYLLQPWQEEGAPTPNEPTFHATAAELEAWELPRRRR